MLILLFDAQYKPVTMLVSECRCKAVVLFVDVDKECVCRFIDAEEDKICGSPNGDILWFVVKAEHVGKHAYSLSSQVLDEKIDTVIFIC